MKSIRNLYHNTCMVTAGLKTLNMSFSDHNSSDIGRIDDKTRVLSKVTGLIAFERLAALTVNLKTNDKRTKEGECLKFLLRSCLVSILENDLILSLFPALNHLKPYASVVLGKILADD